MGDSYIVCKGPLHFSTSNRLQLLGQAAHVSAFTYLKFLFILHVKNTSQALNGFFRAHFVSNSHTVYLDKSTCTRFIMKHRVCWGKKPVSISCTLDTATSRVLRSTLPCSVNRQDLTQWSPYLLSAFALLPSGWQWTMSYFIVRPSNIYCNGRWNQQAPHIYSSCYLHG